MFQSTMMSLWKEGTREGLPCYSINVYNIDIQ